MQNGTSGRRYAATLLEVDVDFDNIETSHNEVNRRRAVGRGYAAGVIQRGEYIMMKDQCGS